MITEVVADLILSLYPEDLLSKVTFSVESNHGFLRVSLGDFVQYTLVDGIDGDYPLYIELDKALESVCLQRYETASDRHSSFLVGVLPPKII